MTDPAEPDPRRWLALGACLAILTMTMLDVSIVVVALPSIGTSLKAQPAELQWVISGYALGFGLVPIIAGRLGDDRGRKQMTLIGTGGFVITSAVIGFAPNPGVLIGARVVQGLAGGLLNPQVSGIVQNLFSARERPRAFAWIGTVVGVAAAAGPVVGGVIIFLGGTDLGWRLTFLINVPAGSITFFLCWRWLPDIPRRRPARRLDLPGTGLLALALLGVLFPAVEYDSNRDLRLAYLLIPAAILFVAFFAWEAGPARRRGYPLIDIGLFRIRSFSDGCGLALIYFGALTALPLVVSFFLQEGLGFNPLETALVSSALAIGVAVSSLVSARLLPRYGGKSLVVALIIFAVGDLLVIVVGWQAAGLQSVAAVGWLLAVPMFVAGLGNGSVTTPNQVLTLADVDVAHGSTAGGMLQSSQRIGIAVGSAIAIAVFYTVALHGHPVTGHAHQIRYGHAFVAAMVFVLVLTLISLVIAIRSVRHVTRSR